MLCLTCGWRSLDWPFWGDEYHSKTTASCQHINQIFTDSRQEVLEKPEGKHLQSLITKFNSELSAGLPCLHVTLYLHVCFLASAATDWAKVVISILLGKSHCRKLRPSETERQGHDVRFTNFKLRGDVVWKVWFLEFGLVELCKVFASGNTIGPLLVGFVAQDSICWVNQVRVLRLNGRLHGPRVQRND